ncbi:MAG: NADH-quinone oxidoreductase subunit L, partial [Candidatus Marinimicrobia bacterium]|nr:NADH-quinone oxidoreductase subunit L [Candidatus Neomarinimicrobiota bacterium]
MVETITDLVWWIPLFPLIGFLLNGLYGKRFGVRGVGIVGSAVIFLSFVISVVLLVKYLNLHQEGAEFHALLFTWIPVGDLQLSISYQIDSLSLLMAVMVTGVAFLIHVYSIGYMSG